MEFKSKAVCSLTAEINVEDIAEVCGLEIQPSEKLLLRTYADVPADDIRSDPECESQEKDPDIIDQIHLTGCDALLVKFAFRQHINTPLNNYNYYIYRRNDMIQKKCGW
jgi:hypothetical protein